MSIISVGNDYELKRKYDKIISAFPVNSIQCCLLGDSWQEILLANCLIKDSWQGLSITYPTLLNLSLSLNSLELYLFITIQTLPKLSTASKSPSNVLINEIDWESGEGVSSLQEVSTSHNLLEVRCVVVGGKLASHTKHCVITHSFFANIKKMF